MVSLWPKNVSIHQTFLPTTFNLAIRQTLMLPNIPIIQYTVVTLPWPLLEW